MKDITFEHLSNSPQLSFLFVLKQKNQKETNKALDKLSSTIPNNSNQIKNFQVVIQMWKHRQAWSSPLFLAQL